MLARRHYLTRLLSALALALPVVGSLCMTAQVQPPAESPYRGGEEVHAVEQDPGRENSDADLDAIKSQFVGNYELVKYQTFRRDGEAIDLDYVGRIMYDEGGNMAAQGMPRDLPSRPRERGQRLSGGFAYFGRFSVDPEKSVVVHHVEGSPTTGRWVGGDNVRYFEFKDGLLYLSLKNAAGRVTGTLSWRKLPN